jgi:Terminase small subunit
MSEFYIVSELAEGLSKREQQIRDRFVEEYIVDYNVFQAALRCGYQEAYATDYSQRFMREPYVQQQIIKRQEALGETGDEAQHKKRIIAGLYKNANDYGPGGTIGGRVAAYNSLMKLLGLEAPVKSVVEVNERPTVQFYIPDNGRK